MVTITAAQMQAETGYSDMNPTNVEYLIDNAIDYVNTECGTSISNLSGSPSSVTVTAGQSAALKPLIVLLMRAKKDKGPNVGLPGVSVSTLIADPQYSLQMQLWQSSLNRLRGQSFDRT